MHENAFVISCIYSLHINNVCDFTIKFIKHCMLQSIKKNRYVKGKILAKRMLRDSRKFRLKQETCSMQTNRQFETIL